MSARVVSVNVGRPALLATGRRVVPSAIGKTPVSGPGRGARHNLGGDEQADKHNHGGPDQAVYAYASEDAAFWSELSAASSARPRSARTSRSRASTSRAPASASAGGSGRWSCASPGRACPVSSSRRASACPASSAPSCTPGRPGAYLAIAGEGELQAGDAVEIVHRPEHEVTVSLVIQALLIDRTRLASSSRRGPTCSRSSPAGTRSSPREPGPAGRRVADRGDVPRRHVGHGAHDVRVGARRRVPAPAREDGRRGAAGGPVRDRAGRGWRLHPALLRLARRRAALCDDARRASCGRSSATTCSASSAASRTAATRSAAPGSGTATAPGSTTSTWSTGAASRRSGAASARARASPGRATRAAPRSAASGPSARGGRPRARRRSRAPPRGRAAAAS